MILRCSNTLVDIKVIQYNNHESQMQLFMAICLTGLEVQLLEKKIKILTVGAIQTDMSQN
jgi:hypothetical protein